MARNDELRSCVELLRLAAYMKLTRMEEVPIYSFFLTPAAWNAFVRAGTPVAILEHEANLRMEAKYQNGGRKREAVRGSDEHGGVPSLDCLSQMSFT